MTFWRVWNLNKISSRKLLSVLNRVRRHEVHKNRSSYEKVMICGSRENFYCRNFIKRLFWEGGVSISGNPLSLLTRHPLSPLSRCPSSWCRISAVRPPPASWPVRFGSPSPRRQNPTGLLAGHRRLPPWCHPKSHPKTGFFRRIPISVFRPNWPENPYGFWSPQGMGHVSTSHITRIFMDRKIFGSKSLGFPPTLEVQFRCLPFRICLGSKN